METKTKKIIVAGAFAILAILLAAGFYLKNKTDNSKQPRPEKQEAVQLQELTSENEMKFQEQASEIIKTKDFSRCQEIPNEMYRKVCTNNIALNLAQETGDFSYCDKLDGELLSVSDCKKNVITKSSVEKNKVEICNDLSDENEKKVCFDNFYQIKSLSEKNIGLCDMITEIDKRNSCKNMYVYSLEFMGNTKNFECQKFATAEAKKDCEDYGKPTQLNPENTQTDLMLVECSKFGSDVFVSECLNKFNK